MLQNSPDMDRINEMRMLAANFPSMAPSYNQEISRIVLRYIEAIRISSPAQNIVNAPKPIQQPDVPTQASIAAKQQRWLDAKPPELTPQEQRMVDLKNILNEVSAINYTKKKVGYYEAPEYKADLKTYQNTLGTLTQMVSEQKALYLADAFYKMEAAFGTLQLTYEEYRKIIAQSAAFIKQWMRENNLSLSNPEAVHYAIQSFMGETLTIKSNNLPGVGTIPHSHKPFIYDYIDYRAEKDIHNHFLTKTLATGTGQCNTLPRVYLVLAEAMGVEAYLTFAPQHSFIKYKNNDGTIQNYEPTVHWHMTDQDYMEEMPIMSAATKNRVYLDTLNKKQIITAVMIDLASNFTHEHWFGDGKFVQTCVENAMNANSSPWVRMQGLMLKNMLLASQLESVLTSAKITDLKDIENSPEAAKIYNEYQANEVEMEAMGLQVFPEEKYNAMLKKHDRRGKLQEAKKINTKAKRSLFFNG